MLKAYGATDLCYSFSTAHPGAVTLHNHPRFMHSFAATTAWWWTSPPSTSCGLGSGCRYNEFRRLLRLSEARSFEDLTQTSQAVAELAAVYDSIQDVDLTVGLHAEPPPPGFSFADTAFRIFIVMASRRLAVTASSRATPIRKPTPPEGIR